MTVTIYHNPRCSKSRQTLELIRGQGIEPKIIEYLTTPPSEKELTDIIDMLHITPHELLRKKETEYKEQHIADITNAKELIKAMVSYPKLIERPIVVNSGKAAIGRPPENVLEIL